MLLYDPYIQVLASLPSKEERTVHAPMSIMQTWLYEKLLASSKGSKGGIFARFSQTMWIQLKKVCEAFHGWLLSPCPKEMLF